MAATLKSLFDNIVFDEKIADGTVLSIAHKKQNNSLIFQLALAETVPFPILFDAAEKIRVELNSGKVSIYPKYSSELFTTDSVLGITDFLRNEGESVNGYFDDAEITIDGNKCTIELKHGGGDLLLGDNIDGKIRKFAKGFYGVDIEVDFTGKTSLDLDEYSERMAEELASLPVPPPPPAAPASAEGTAPYPRRNEGAAPQKKSFSRGPVIHNPPEAMTLLFSHESFRDDA